MKRKQAGFLQDTIRGFVIVAIFITAQAPKKRQLLGVSVDVLITCLHRDLWGAHLLHLIVFGAIM